MKKAYIHPTGHKFDLTELAKWCEIVDTERESDITLSWVAIPDRDPAQVILAQSEPPISRDRIWSYQNADLFHTFVTHNPQGYNQIPFSETSPHLFPYMPWMAGRVTRPTEELRKHGTGSYFAGHVPNRQDKTAITGDEIIYQKRAEWAQVLQSALGGKCVGNGWPETTKDAPAGWGPGKFEDLEEGNYDFHFCAENCIRKGYHSEKFWHGLLADRVMVYMGHQGIKKLVDPGAYVFAEDFGSPEVLANYLKHMAKEDYLDTIRHARYALGKIGTKPRDEMRDLSRRIGQRIQEAI